MTPPDPAPAPDTAPIVFVVDDDEAVRRSLCWLLGSADMRAEAFASAPEFLDSITGAHAGCVVTDVRMPGPSGLDLQDELARRGIDLPIILVTGHGDVRMAVRAMKAGAFDFVEKPFDDRTLLDLVHRAVAKNLADRRAEAERGDVRARIATLTPRERQVLDLIVAGEPNKGIAHRLGISEKTVETHRAHVMEKMEARSFAELMKWVLPLKAD